MYVKCLFRIKQIGSHGIRQINTINVVLFKTLLLEPCETIIIFTFLIIIKIIKKFILFYVFFLQSSKWVLIESILTIY